jgi:hypothetical protein
VPAAGPAARLLGELLAECVAAWDAYADRRFAGAEPSGDDPRQYLAGKRLLALPASDRAEALVLAMTRDSRIPGLAKLDRTKGDEHIHHDVLASVIAELLAQQLALTEGDLAKMVASDKTGEFRDDVITLAFAWVNEHGLSRAMAKGAQVDATVVLDRRRAACRSDADDAPRNAADPRATAALGVGARKARIQEAQQCFGLGRNVGSSTYSVGVWKPAPRGPRPSIAGTPSGATVLASEPPPSSAPRRRRGRRRARTRRTRRGARRMRRCARAGGD